MKAITSLEEIITLANNRKAVVMPGGGRTAAAFLVGMPLRTVYNYMQTGRLYIYEKKKK